MLSEDNRQRRTPPYVTALLCVSLIGVSGCSTPSDTPTPQDSSPRDSVVRASPREGDPTRSAARREALAAPSHALNPATEAAQPTAAATGHTPPETIPPDTSLLDGVTEQVAEQTAPEPEIVLPNASRTDADVSLQGAAAPAEEDFARVGEAPGSCASHAIMTVEQDSLELYAAVQATLDAAYGDEGLRRIDAIWWSAAATLRPEILRLYELAVSAADEMSTQPEVTVDHGRVAEWRNINVGQYQQGDECVPTQDVNIAKVELLVPVVGDARPKDLLIVTDGTLEIFHSGMQKLRWQDGRWKLDWMDWCLTVGAAQGEGGHALFADALAENGVPVGCAAESIALRGASPDPLIP